MVREEESLDQDGRDPSNESIFDRFVEGVGDTEERFDLLYMLKEGVAPRVEHEQFAHVVIRLADPLELSCVEGREICERCSMATEDDRGDKNRIPLEGVLSDNVAFIQSYK